MGITSLWAYLTPILLPSNFTSTLHYRSFQTWVAPLYLKAKAQPIKKSHREHKYVDPHNPLQCHLLLHLP